MTINIQGGWWWLVALIVARVVGLVRYLFKIYIPKKIELAVQHRYDTKLAIFEHGLTMKATQFQNDLTTRAAERNLRFSHIYSKTAEVLLDYYKKMTDSFGHITFMLYEIEPVDGLQNPQKSKKREDVLLMAKDYTTFHANHR